MNSHFINQHALMKKTSYNFICQNYSYWTEEKKHQKHKISTNLQFHLFNEKLNFEIRKKTNWMPSTLQQPVSNNLKATKKTSLILKWKCTYNGFFHENEKKMSSTNLKKQIEVESNYSFWSTSQQKNQKVKIKEKIHPLMEAIRNENPLFFINRKKNLPSLLEH